MFRYINFSSYPWSLASLTTTLTIILGIVISRSALIAAEATETQKTKQVPSAGGDEELLQYAFADPLIPGEQLLKPITSLDGIHAANRSLFTPVELFFDAYEKLEIVDTKTLAINDGATKILRLSYKLGGLNYQAYAYVKQGQQPAKRAALIIPGSAFNLSTAIAKEDPKSNHVGIMQALGDDFDRFVFIKPNEDCLAFHDGKRKLAANFFVNWQLDAGGSYSVHYIVHTLAFSKYLKQKYPILVVAGLSQGGGAALLNTLQSQPTAAVIASGFSIINKRAQWSGHNQIIIPGLRKRLSHETVRTKMQKSPTQFLLTYGKKEVGTYQIEVTQRPSAQFLSHCQNVTVQSHAGGHTYSPDIVRKFLQDTIPATKARSN